MNVVKLHPKTVYVRSMGKVLEILCIALDTSSANAYMAQHDEAAIIAEFGDLAFIADRYDKGLKVEKEIDDA